MKIVVRGGEFSNRGAEAMLRTVQCEMLRRVEALEISATVSPAGMQLSRAAGIIPVTGDFGSRVTKLLGQKIGARIGAWRLISKCRHLKGVGQLSRKAALEIFRAEPFEMVVDVSGFSYSDQCSWGRQEAIEARAWAAYCKERGIPYVFLPQAWGPFENPILKGHVAAMCRDAAVVYSRDDSSTEHLQPLLAEGSVKLKQAPDIVFLLPDPPVEYVEEVRSRCGIRAGRPVVVISPNMRVFEKTAKASGSNPYVRLLVSLVRHMIAAHDAFVLIHPNEVFPAGRQGCDDRFVCGLVEAAVHDPASCKALDQRTSPMETKALLAGADMVIASRFHSLVFALGAGVPSVALGWSHKYVELMRDCGLEDNVIDWGSDVAFEDVRDLVDRNWDARTDNRAKLQKALPKIREDVSGVFDALAALVSSPES